MTEDEAKGKWCPFARVSIAVRPSDDVDHASNRPEHDAYNCIGSACMAWRWVLVHDGSFNTTLAGPQLEVTERIPNLVQSDHGFCGLAGAPQ